MVLIVTLIFAMGLVLTGCSMEGDKSGNAPPAAEDTKKPESPSGGESGEGKKIGFSIAMLAGSPFWQIISDELERGFKELGYEFVVLDAQGDAAKQASDVEDLIAQKVDIILVNPYDSDAIVPVTLSARDAGIPVMAVDIPVAEAGYSIATCICDNVMLGYQLGEYAADKFNTPEVKVVVISGYPNGIDSRQRRHGFIEGFHAKQLEKFAQTGLRIVHHGWGDYAREPANKTMEDAITRTNGDFDIVYCENDDMAIGALRAMESANITGKMILGVDGLKEMYELIRDGYTTATGRNSPVELAAVSVQATHDYLNGKEIPEIIFTTPTVVEKKNIDEFYDPDSIF